MRDRCYRDSWPAACVPVLLLSVVGLLLSCSNTVESELVVLNCVDQNGNPLPPGVTVSVEGLSEIWRGDPLRFPIKVEDGVRLVAVKAGASGGYVFNSKSEYPVQAGVATNINLHFFRPYLVTVAAPSDDTDGFSGAAVFANGERIGRADERGRFTWRIERPNTPVGIARPGSRFDIVLDRDGEQAVAAPVILSQGQFTYDAQTFLDPAAVTPAYGFAAAAQEPTPDAEASPPRTSTPSAATSRSSQTRPPAAATPDPDPAVPITEARPRPPTFEPTRQEPNALRDGTPSATPEPPATEDPQAAIPTPLQHGDQAFAMGRYDEAKRIYSNIPPGSPDFKRARQRLGEIHLETRNYQGAVTAFEDILREDPSEYAAYNNLAAVYLATESYNEALDNLDQVLARKHLIPKSKRRQAELEVRYTRAAIHYVQFQQERDAITKKEQGLLAMGIMQTFIDMVPEGDEALQSKRREMEQKLDDIRVWVRSH